jgi:hypothetical protein
MPKAVELLRQGRTEELWQMCCGFLDLSLDQFMNVQERLLLEQVDILGNSSFGLNLLGGDKPRTLDEFRRQVPLTRYPDYCPQLIEKKEEGLPGKPELWARTSGKTGDYPCKWIPISAAYYRELSKVLYGIGMISCCRGRGDTSRIPDDAKLLYSVAPRPYISGTFADALRAQTPLSYLPSLEEAENLVFEDRIKLGFSQALSEGLDYFFGLSLVLVAVGEKFRQSTDSFDIRPFLNQPKALLRLAKGKLKSRLAGRQMLPRDLWPIRGIIGSGVDSWIYKDKIKELWGRYPLDLYSCTEGGIIATQAWDYGNMTFLPNLNLLEFIPEDEQLKWQMDHSYRPKTLLLDEVRAGEAYEMVISNFHGGVMTRYRVGDIVHITSLRNERLGIELPQMAFERRADDLINFTVIKLTEKQIWEAIESAGVAYEDWVAYKAPGETVLHLLLEPKEGFQCSEAEINSAIQAQIINSGKNNYNAPRVVEDWRESFGFSVEVVLLPKGTFANYTASRRAEGADLAHLKPPHINPSGKVLTMLSGRPIAVKAGIRVASAPRGEKVAV